MDDSVVQHVDTGPSPAATDAEPMDLSDKATAAVDWQSLAKSAASESSQSPSSSPALPPPHSSISFGIQSPVNETFSFGGSGADPRSLTRSESSESRGGGEDSESDVTSLCSAYAASGEGVVVDSMMSGGGSGMQNQVGTVRLRGVQIVSLMIDGKERLCLAQISNTLLKNFSYNEIHNRRVALGITCVQVRQSQLVKRIVTIAQSFSPFEKMSRGHSAI